MLELIDLRAFLANLMKITAVFALAGGMAVAADDELPSLYVIADQSDGTFLQDSFIESSVTVVADTAVVNDQAGALKISLNDGVIRIADAIDFQRRTGDSVTWTGRFRSDADSRVVLTTNGDAISGLIINANTSYVLEPSFNGQTILKKLIPQQFPECAEPVVPEYLPFGSQQSAPDAGSDSSDLIDLMVLYTPQARDAVGGTLNIETIAQNAVDTGNQAFANSNVATRFRMVYTGLANYNDSGNSSLDLAWVRSDSTVSALRDTHAADLVSLLVENGGGFCGRGYVMRSVSPAFADYAFQVTTRACAVGNLSFAHEHGHNMGMEHDPANGASAGAASYPWSFGHYQNGSYRTVMSYSNQCTNGCTRVPHFSNPNVTYNALATGIADQRDNHRTANNVASTVANFRSSSGCLGVSDVVLENRTLDSASTITACNSITAGNSLRIGSSANVLFNAGTKIVLNDGFTVADNGMFQARIGSLSGVSLF